MRLSTLILTLLPSLLFGQMQLKLTGDPVETDPGFRFCDNFNVSDPIAIYLNPNVFTAESASADIYVVENRNEEEWAADQELIDVRISGEQSISTDEALHFLAGSESLESETGDRPGHGYDVVIDVNQNGMLDESDLIDGLGTKAGLYRVGLLGAPGPYDVVTTEYSPSFWNTMEIFYPFQISSMEDVPVVIVSHGWTHLYTLYNHIGEHMASHGYVVMSHRNDVGDGGTAATATAAQTALENMDVFFNDLGEIDGGILEGHLDQSRIVHTGHSTGGECVVYAYKQLYDGVYQSPNFDVDDIRCVISLAPVSWWPQTEVHPEDVNYHQFLCTADTDVSGWAQDNYVQALAIYERARGNKSVLQIHGAGHEDLHNGTNASWASGPDLIGREATHTVLLPYFLALAELYVWDNMAMEEFLTRNAGEYRPTGIDASLVLSNEYRKSLEDGVVIDDYQSENSIGTASSGANVSRTNLTLQEVLMQDHDLSFNWDGQWSNGMCRSRYDDDPYCAVFAWEQSGNLTFTLTPELQNWWNYESLSFRSCQVTRHPLNAETTAFEVVAIDGDGNESVIDIRTYGALNEPYQKSNGGYLSTCLEPGEYEIYVGGSNWEEEMFFTIPGYLEYQPAGTYSIQIDTQEDCEEIEVLMFDTWGDGWDAGSLEITNEQETIVAEGTMLDGFDPDTEGGWQNEFYTYQIPVESFWLGSTPIDRSNIQQLQFRFGEDGFSETGAIGLDDIQLLTTDPVIPLSVNDKPQTNAFRLYPNPARDWVRIDFGAESSGILQVQELSGKICLEQYINHVSQLQLELGTLMKGMYTVSFQGDNEHQVSKLMIQ